SPCLNSGENDRAAPMKFRRPAKKLRPTANHRKAARPAAKRRKSPKGAAEASAAETPSVPLEESSLEKAPSPNEEITRDYDGSTALTLYMREVGQVRLLTAKEEIELARKVQKGNPKAREQMIRANLRIVVKIAREYENIGLPLLDLINEGNIGLMTAVERFDPAKGARLSTYASWWIKQSMRRALANQSKTIRIPVHMVDKISHMRRVAFRLQQELEREPTDAEVGGELGVSSREVARMRASHARPASLDAPLGDDDLGRLADVIRDENATSPDDHLEEKNVTKML